MGWWTMFDSTPLPLTSYLKDKDISTEKTDHIKTANKLWKVREKYLSLLTDFDEISIERDSAQKR